jgi:hypothetical protein
MLSVECEKLEAIGFAGGKIDLDVYGQLTDRLGRAFQRLGLKRVPREALTLFALPMSPEQVEIFQRRTGRTSPPTEIVLALIAVFLAADIPFCTANVRL